MPVFWCPTNISWTLAPYFHNKARLLPCEGVNPVTLVNHGRKHRWIGCDGKPRTVCQFCGLTKHDVRDPTVISLAEALLGN